MVEVRIQGEVERFSLEEFEARVRAGRIRADMEIRFDPVTGPNWTQAGELEMFRDLATAPTRRTATRLPDHAPPIAAALLVGINIRIWWIGNAFDQGSTTSALLTDWLSPMLLDGEVWRLVTMGFAHVAFGHIASNLIWFALAASLLERVLGRANMVVIYLFAVLVGSVASAFGAPISPSLGASGGVFGLIGALVVFGMRHPDLLTRRERQFFGWTMVPYVVFMIWSGLQSETTDNYAHVFGLLGGAGLTLALSPRHPDHNRRVRTRVLATSTVLMLLMAFTGPRIYPLWDSEVATVRLLAARGKQLPEFIDRPERLASYGVPAGWGQTTSPAGTAGFRAPSPHPDRASGVSVTQAEHATLTDAQTRFEAFSTTLERAWPSLVPPSPEPTTLAGEPGLRATFEFDGELTLEWFGATRGVFSLEVIWWVDSKRSNRLAPLRDRVLASVVWSEPAALADARLRAEESPGPSSRRRLATELARVGEVDEAHALLKQLVTDSPDSAAAWISMIELYATRDEEPPFDEALASAPDPELALAVARDLVRRERHAEARGILDIAGGRWPAHKGLRRARLRDGLPARRDRNTRVPWHLARDIDGTALSDVDREALIARSLTLSAAIEASARLDALDARAIDLAVSHPDARLAALCYLKYRYLPEDRQAAARRIRADLEKSATGHTPSWIPSPIAALAGDAAFLSGIPDPPQVHP